MSGADILKQLLRRIDKKDNPIVRENQKNYRSNNLNTLVVNRLSSNLIQDNVLQHHQSMN